MGNANPPTLQEPTITLNDRYVIYHLVVYGLSYREIGCRLNKHHTTISREIKRNWKGWGRYWHEPSQVEAESKKHIARHHRKQRKVVGSRLTNHIPV